MRLAAFAGRFALFIAGMALLTFISLFVVGAYLATWPIMRVSPRSRRLTSLMELATAAMGAARAYGLDKFTEPPAPDATEDTEPEYTPEYPYNDGDTVVLGPNCFASSDGSVLNWLGVNFIPQHPPHDERG